MKRPEQPDFRARLIARETLVGTFVKTSSHQIVEVLGGASLDFVVIDAEHAPFSRDALDVALLAARAAHLPALVRVPAARDEHIGNALDCGAAGVIVPHVRNADDASSTARACRYRQGTRGFSTSPRAGRYGLTAMHAMIDESDRGITSLAMIEDADALAHLDAIVDTDIDALFIGRADLAISCGLTSLDDPQLARHVATICEAAASNNKAVAMFVGSAGEIALHASLGVSAFVVGSDQSLMRAAVNTMVEAAQHAAANR